MDLDICINKKLLGKRILWLSKIKNAIINRFETKNFKLTSEVSIPIKHFIASRKWEVLFNNSLQRPSQKIGSPSYEIDKIQRNEFHYVKKELP